MNEALIPSRPRHSRIRHGRGQLPLQNTNDIRPGRSRQNQDAQVGVSGDTSHEERTINNRGPAVPNGPEVLLGLQVSHYLHLLLLGNLEPFIPASVSCHPDSWPIRIGLFAESCHRRRPVECPALRASLLGVHGEVTTCNRSSDMNPISHVFL
jgi:hypothetical protein